ncbi:hypothetical protein [Gloeobacter kilaueensis]|uniref:Uncharacterized protein n=1 Tax=Gloeobacter kilaueensis (strain ATCC BAA-2537 / CCAP 1431/1 / ULC 316 / JS1) TaxID=1183438 RepID=U5QCF5_GLOK1|nr:hypothetical protein [Gloeobacter kilaueensis]AGY56513.1 hypothetical protein GKIL_0266 [Gloeobacter kilaueensis JS1]
MSHIQQLSEINGLDYVVVGVALCYQKNADGKTDPVRIAEPIPATALEAMGRGIRTSFEKIYAATLGEVLDGEHPLLPADIFGSDSYACRDFATRVKAATRTYKAKPHLRLVPSGTVCSAEEGAFKLQYDPAFRRILGAERTVSDSDNIKQHSHTHKVLT